jgi:hypothetical protein
VVALAERLRLPVTSGAEQIAADFPPADPAPGTRVDTLAVSWSLGERQALDYTALRIQSAGAVFSTQYSCLVRANVADASAVARALIAAASGPVTASLSEGGLLLIAYAPRGETSIMVGFRFDTPLGGYQPRTAGAPLPRLETYLPRMGRPATVRFTNPSLGPPR